MSWQFSKISSITEAHTGVSYSGDEFLSLIKARQLDLSSRLKISSHHRVLLLAENSASFFIHLLALFRLGASVIPLDPGSAQNEIEQIIEEAGVHFFICEDSVKCFERQTSSKSPDEALILFSSGSTGKPKGIVISYEALKQKLLNLALVISEEERKSVLCGLPVYFGHGLICNSLFALFYAEDFTLLKKFDLHSMNFFAEILLKKKITFFSSVPSVWHLILNFTSPLSSSFLKRVHCASSPLFFNHAQNILSWLGDGVDFYNVFGTTETLGWVLATKVKKDEIPDFFNLSWSTQCKSGDGDELLLKSNAMFSGYLNNEEETQKSLTNEGFFKTGDQFSEGKYLGRLKEVINKNGIKIYPAHIDQVLMSSGLVSDCHTFALADVMTYQSIAVILTLKTSASLDDVKNFCRNHLAENRYPDSFFVLDKIPRNARGKVAKATLEQLSGGFNDK